MQQEQEPEPELQQEQNEATEQTQDAVDQMQERTDQPTKDVGTFWNKLDVVFDKLIKGEEGPVNPNVQEVIDQLPSEDAFVAKNLRSIIYQPDKISLNSSDGIDTGNNPFQFNSFKVRFVKPLLNVKSVELIRASFPTPVPTISDQECVFWYYRYPNASVPTTVAGLSTDNLYFIRLQNSWIPPELVGTQYAYNRTFNSYDDLVSELNIATTNEPLSTYGALAGLNWASGDITFSYNTRMNKIVMTGNNAAFTYLPVGGYTDKILQPILLLIAKTAGQYPYSGINMYNLGEWLGRYQGLTSPGTGSVAAAIGSTINPVFFGTLNRRLGFVWDEQKTDSVTFQNLWRPTQSGSTVVVSTRAAYAQTYGCLVNTACVYVYVDFVQGSSQDSKGNGGLLGVVPLNTANNSVGFYDKVMSNDLFKIPSQLQEITVFLKDERLQDFLLPRSAIANLELGFTYY
jgi:hypothetical protein